MYLTRGSILVKLGRFQEAIADFTKAISINPSDSAAALVGRAMAREELGLHGEAVADLAKAVEVVPSYLPTRLYLAEVLLCGGDAGKCLDELRKSESYVYSVDDRLAVSYLRLLATKVLRQDTTKIEPEFATLAGKDVKIMWRTNEVQNWLSSSKVDAETKAFANSLSDRLQAKKDKGK